MAINVNITSMKDFDKAIEKIGALQEKIAELKKERDALTDIVSAYAVEKDICEGVAGDYEYKLTGAPRAIKKNPEVPIEEIIARLESKPETSAFVYKGVATDALKKAFAKNAATRKEVEKYGYFFTEPEKNKIKVEVRG